MSLTTQQRRDRILAQIFENGHAEVKVLASLLEVSEATVRRDLRVLADSNQVELVYGGATLPRTSDFSFRSKAMRNVEAKRIIGRLAAQMVQDNEQLYIDSGTTCFEMSHYLKMKRNISVIVNSTRLAVELGGQPDISIIMCGGHYRGDRMDNIGPLATSTIDQLRGYMAFIGADGLSMDFGVTASDIESAHLYRNVIRNARETILMVDHSKFLTPSLFKIADMDAISRVVTDREPIPEWMTCLNDLGIEVIFPKVELVQAGSPAASGDGE